MSPANVSLGPKILDDRAAILLKQLVASYIDDGQPVGSKQLAHDAGFTGPPATIDAY